MTSLGIVELVDVCARHRAINLDLFETLGALVAAPQTQPGLTQQLLARACHRHAWHAELWADRAPTIPAPSFSDLTASHRGALPAVHDAATYRLTADLITSELTMLRARIDPTLDPSTDRVVSLVLFDLAALNDDALAE